MQPVGCADGREHHAGEAGGFVLRDDFVEPLPAERGVFAPHFHIQRRAKPHDEGETGDFQPVGLDFGEFFQPPFDGFHRAVYGVLAYADGFFPKGAACVAGGFEQGVKLFFHRMQLF